MEFTLVINNPLPAIVRLEPNYAIPGGDTFILTVYGSNFVLDSKVYWNGTERPTHYVSASQLEASISATDIANPGVTLVKVVNPAPGGGSSDPLDLPVTTLHIITQPPLPQGTVGVPYSQVFEAEGGLSPYQWSIAAGTLPPGLTLNEDTGEVSGIPTAAGTYGFTMAVTDNSGVRVRTFFTVAPNPPPGQPGQPYPPTQVNPGSCSDFVLIGILPPGLILDPTSSIISGIPSAGGIYEFTVSCTVSLGQTVEQVFTINIINPNHPPVLTVDAAMVSVNEGQTAINTGGVSDPDGNAVTLSASVGTVNNNGDGTWSWSHPTSDGLTNQTVTITADDRQGGNIQTTFDLIVNNVAPTANAGGDQTIFRNAVVTLSGTWSDPAGALDNPYAWSWDLNSDGLADDSGSANDGDTIVRTTSFMVDGTASLTFSVTDKDGTTGSDTVQITVVNRTPTANNQTVNTAEDTALPITLAGSDADNDPLTFSVLDLPSHGVLTGIVPNLTYTPDPDFFSPSGHPDSFTFKVNDGLADSNVATINITVNPVNDPAVALDDTVPTAEDTPVIVPVQANDSAGPSNEDPTLTTTAVTDPPHGTAVINPDGSVTYTPDLDFSDTDSFGYTVCDSEGACATATVTVLVDQVNDPPVAHNDDITTLEDTPVTINVIANDIDVDGNLDPDSVIVLLTPTHGTLVDAGNGVLTYTPNPNFNGTDSFKYQVCDTDTICTDATVKIMVTPDNDSPVCSTAAPSVAILWPPNHQFEPVSITGVTDEEGNPITIAVTTIFQDEPTNGTGDSNTSPDGQGIGSATAQVRAELKVNGNGRYYHISFTASDGNSGACSGMVKVSVPKNMGNNGAAVDDGPLYNSTQP
jgi:large repetitive protein